MIPVFLSDPNNLLAVVAGICVPSEISVTATVFSHSWHSMR